MASLRSLSFAFTFAFSLSSVLSTPYHSLSPLPKIPPPRPKIFSLSSAGAHPSRQQKLASDLLSLLGSKHDAAKISKKEAHEIRSCLRFLVPPPPPPTRRDLLAGGGGVGELVWWPPAPVMELARIAVDSGGDPAAIHRALDPTMLPIPDVEGCKADKCELTRTPYGWRFVNKELNSYLAFLFNTIVARGPSIGLNVSLCRYDLFHGHLFLASGSGRLGILFHAKEYPEYNKEIFPYNTGYCQKGSNVVYDESMNLRNILWLAPLPSNTTKAWLAPGVLVALDAHPNGIIYKEMVPWYVDYVRTIYEDDFGDVAVDVNYLNLTNTVGGDKIFIC